MGQPDLSTKGLTSYPDVAADIINVFVYNGKQIIQEQDLKPYIPNESIVKTEGLLKGLNRDICLENIRDGMRYAIFGFENQNDIDYTMPLRIMGYDYSVYARQVEELIAQNKETQKESWVHKLRKGQKVRPVITFVLFYGNKNEMPEYLLDMIELPKDPQILPYIQNYRVNLVCLRDLTPQQINSFKSDFSCIAKYLNKQYNRNQLITELQGKELVLAHPKDTLYTLAALTHDNRYLAVHEQIKEGTSKMCEIADALEKIGYDKGLAAGIETGKYSTLISQTCNKLKKGYSASDIADILEEDINVIQKICDTAAPYAPDYPTEKILETFLKLLS